MARIGHKAFRTLLEDPAQGPAVTIPGLDLERDLSQDPCNWQLLRILSGVQLSDMAHLPLAGIESCILRGFLGPGQSYYPNRFAAALVNMGMTEMTFQPTPNGCPWGSPEPVFMIGLSSLTPDQAAQLLAFVTQNMEPGALSIHIREHLLHPTVLAGFAAIPATITTVCFDMETHGHAQDTGGPGVVSHLPPHVTTVVLVLLHEIGGLELTLGYPRRPVLPDWLDTLPKFVRGVTIPLQLVLVGGLECPVWTAQDQNAVLDLLRELVDEGVQVHFQNKPPGLMD